MNLYRQWWKTDNTSSVCVCVYVWFITFYYLHNVTAGVNAANMFGMGRVHTAFED